MKHFETKYGYFTENGDFVVTNVRTPAPWINVLTNGRYGAVYSQAGSGYSFYIDASQSMLTRWVQDLVHDNYGKYFYILGEETGEIFSSTFQPLKKNGDYSVVYSPGTVVFHTSFEKFSVKTTAVVSIDHDVEILKLELENKTNKPLNLSIFSYFELNMGTVSDVHREFHKLFFETQFSKNTLISKKYMWTAGPKSWNDSYPFILFHSTSRKVASYETDKEKFFGMYGDLKNPVAVQKGQCKNTAGRNIDGINAIQVRVSLAPLSKETVYFFLGATKDEKEALDLSAHFQDESFCESQIEKVQSYWQNLLKKFRVNIPDKDVEFLLNTWLPYQAIAGRLMARTAYYQIGGAFGYRDQLQDSLAGLWLDPSITQKQILLHAAHQRQDGTVQHWWLPFSNGSPSERWSDDLLWLVFVVCEYIEHTGDTQILYETVPFLEGEQATIKEHCFRSIRSVLENVSERGIPLIFGGDWNDGLNGLGQEGKGESFWLSEFLYFILKRVLTLFELDEDERKWLEESMEKIRESFNKHAWNGEWFNRATSDDGKIIGGKEDNRIFLNPQNWAVISKITDDEKIQKAMEKVKERLITDYGPLLLYPPFTEVDEKIGYITRYAPGTRENGGVYTHAATWTLWSAWLLRDCELAERVYQTLSPILRYYKDPVVYKAEPYVTPGNSDGPLSSKSGKAGWTWYTGSASWLYRLLIQCYLGIKPTKDGILFSPCTKKRWKEGTITFTIRRGQYTLEIINPESKELHEFKEILFNGKKLEGNLIPYCEGNNRVQIIY
ncbi:MAG: glycosyl transferase family 36 [Pseudothermotoga sp.]|uniref:GH36-type glycosyl hydrolase domain-containing protein n=1 Tax=Pseudothermotoga sp. TaxID=2033661 RepID=UPI00076CF33A|nr:MAG: Cellobiose phosphorylase [Thermotoga sp. 50_64]MBC7116177.1 glycosyl transferase family 36 [Pseudothermotoga sp.]HBT38799.1 glycosyl transferase family 36 [Pseudothermotoga sp.]HCO98312.1 glycosyl transferase family 36 [Pseudothermotoga sp.]